ncbi:MAG: dihydroneopterin aldolase [Eggerthellaceae bacterium]|nr:dihydroneopterin aldolase [Eggerthellaceae bacterium]
MGTIHITDLHVFAHHGVYEHERKMGQPYLFNVDLTYDMTQAIESDDIEQALDYADVCNFIDDFSAAHTFSLIETLAGKLADALIENYPLIQEATILVKKPFAPMGLAFDYVSAEVTRTR